MKASLSEIDLTMTDIKKDENEKVYIYFLIFSYYLIIFIIPLKDFPERSMEDDQAIAQAVNEVEQELGPGPSKNSKSENSFAFPMFVMGVLAGGVYFYLKNKGVV